MHVAYLVNQYPKVSHTFIRREIQALERAGLTVHRFALRGWTDSPADREDQAERERTEYLLQGGGWPLLRAALQEALGAPLRFVKALCLACRLGIKADRPLPLHLVYLLEACLLKRRMKACGLRHVHAHFGTNPAEVALLCHTLGGGTFSFTVHGPEEFDKPLALHLMAKAAKASFVVAVSSFGRSQLYRWLPQRHWHKVIIVHCGIEPAFHAGQPPGQPEAARLVCVGRLCEQKGQLLLVEAAHRVKQAGIDFELVLAGDGEMRDAVASRIADLGLRDRVHITGWIDSAAVKAHILASRALVLPSFAEGLPVVLMEAMSLRRPVISTYVAGIPELVDGSNCGWLVPAGDVDALVAVIESCLRADPQVLATMGETAYQRVLRRHDIDTAVRQLVDAFEKTGRETLC